MGENQILEMPKEVGGYIKISNQGEIDINSLLLLGATSKRGDNSKIGFFGSGLKYAMAVLLKNNIPFNIFAGEKEIKVSTSKQKFRGVDVSVIKVNNKLTSLTTDMGPDWKAWFAIRELYCNAIDEGNHSISIAGSPVGVKGETNIFVKFDYQLAELFTNWNLYFSDKRSDVVVRSPEHGTTLFSGNKSQFIVYRKGVRCYEAKEKCLYHYDLTWARINESRVLENTWDLQSGLSKVWGKIATREMVADLFNNYADTFESGLSWGYVSFFNQNWLDVIGGRELMIDSVAGYFVEDLALNREKFLILPADIVNSLKSYFGNRIRVKGMTDSDATGVEIPMDKQQAVDCKFAVDFLEKGGIKIEAPIKIYKFTSESKLGEAKDGEIRLSQKVFNMGIREVIATILEENSHLESGAGDKTRSFQEYLMQMVINSISARTGIRV